MLVRLNDVAGKEIIRDTLHGRLGCCGPLLGIIPAPARKALLSVKLAHVYIIGVFVFVILRTVGVPLTENTDHFDNFDNSSLNVY